MLPFFADRVLKARPTGGGSPGLHCHRDGGSVITERSSILALFGRAELGMRVISAKKWSKTKLYTVVSGVVGAHRVPVAPW